MTEHRQSDERLRAALAEAHRETAARTPPFGRLWSRAAAAADPRRRRRTTLRWATATAAVALVVLLAGVERLRRSEPAPPFTAEMAAATIGAWQAPLDFLLETPGHRWLESTPSWSLESTVTGWGGPAGPLKEVVR